MSRPEYEVFSRPSHPIQPWTSRPDPPASLSSLATGFSARAKLCGLSLGRLSLAVCPPLSSLATGFSARACAPTPAWPKLCGLSRMSSLQPAAHALISDLWRPTTGLGVVGGVVAPSHVIAASDTNTYADPNTAMPSNDDASVSAPPEHASSPPILPDTSSRDAFLDSALPMPNSPPLHVPTLALPLNTALEAMETSTLGAHQLFDNDDDMDIDYDNETENQTENPKGLRIRTKRKPVTRKAAPVVHPTADDLRPFKSAHLRFAKPYWGRTSYALSPGDRAFVVDGPHCKFSGLVDHLLKNEHGEFVAVLVGWPSETPHPTISQLRRHLLDPGPVPRICDRVLVVDGPYRDEVATIESIEGHIIRIGNPSMVEPVEVEIGHVARYFLPGDSVWMAGEDQGGLLTEMQPSLGMVSILVDPKRGLMKEVPQSEVHFDWSDYPGSWTRITPWGPLTEQDHEREELKLRALIDDAYKLMKSEKKSAPGGITSRRKLMAMAKAEHAYRQNRWWDAVQELKVATDLELEDDEHITRRLAAVISARANGALKKTREHSEDLTDFNRKMMKTGLCFEGLEVKIIAPNYGSRTLKGIITGDHDSEARRQREKLNNAKELLRLCRHDLEGILATVSYDKHAPVENVPIEYIVEWETQIPLSRAVYVKHGWNSRTFQLPESLPPAPALPPARPLTPPPDPSSSLLPFELPRETDGSWLYQGNRFVGKCLEAVVHITARTKGTRKLTIRDTQKSKEGMGGFLLVATEYTKDSVMTVYGLPPSGVPVKFTGSCLAPSRAHSDGVRVDERMNERVVIIGEDSLHDVSHIGQYGLVVDKLPPEHAVVQHEDPSRHQYHWKSLCLSTNKERYQGETSFPATIF
ncbi:hypothetical protein FB45DRAFT_1032156 [Roridomyces roridus]|uniref:KOW domain-containing protein n=1 Tax=Roridomyces roridus TaxID=1738132 RepID=A0AAD7BJ44_9AGAR|nr:hypothetical protein FB45DRAFT_1032156 [Roridomyces roridus]